MSKQINLKNLAAVAIIAVIVLSGCGITVRHHSDPMYQRPGPDHRRAYELRMERNEREIARLKNSQQRDDIYVIELKHNDMKQKLNSFKGSTKKEWKSFKREFNHDMKGVEKSLDKFSKHNKISSH